MALSVDTLPIEDSVCHWLNNYFVIRQSKTTMYALGNTLDGALPTAIKDDRVFVKGIGLFAIEESYGDHLVVDSKIPTGEYEVWLMRYPRDFEKGIKTLAEYEKNNDNSKNADIASETISRHSVTYSNKASTEYSLGYPKKLMQVFLQYSKARF